MDKEIMEPTTTEVENQESNIPQRVSIMDLEFEDQFKVMWGWFWRGLCVSIVAMVLAMIAGGIVGIICGVILTVVGIEIESVKIYLQLFGGAIGFVIGFMSLLPLIKWITNSQYGKYQIMLVKTSDD